MIKNCSNCVNNVEYPKQHTCDICTSLDQEKEYEMWEEKTTTTVYLVKEYGGEWEEAYEYIRKAFFSKGKAEEYKLQLEQEEKEIKDQYEKCDKCPYKYGENNEYNKCTCDKYKLDEDGYCENYDYMYEDCWYSIEELEVEK